MNEFLNLNVLEELKLEDYGMLLMLNIISFISLMWLTEASMLTSIISLILISLLAIDTTLRWHRNYVIILFIFVVVIAKYIC